MKPPADRLLDFNGAGTDMPAFAVTRGGVRWRHVLAAATALGVLSTTLAWQFTVLLGQREPSLTRLAALNFAWWYLWALLAPPVIWLAQHARIERGALRRAAAVHLPAVVLISCTHIAAMQGVHWWIATVSGLPFDWWTQVRRLAILYLDWEMMTYWAIVGLTHALLYYRESQARALRAAHLERQRAATRLQLLQQQLHPHFLFNALNAISALMHRDVDAADRMLIRLSDLLRMTLEHLDRGQVPLEVELDALTRYVEIEQTRFGDRLAVRFEVHPETLRALVPSLVLQPLVENAVKHGVARKAGPGRIDVSARREGDKLRLEVRDDGVGLSEDSLTALQKGIGVSTTRARLHQLFGADFWFEFHRLAQGLAVIVAVPWQTAPEERQAAEPAVKAAHARDEQRSAAAPSRSAV
jgi:signal transduction histidine kinase